MTQSDVTLSQPSSVTASLEATAKLQCNISRGFYFGYSVWYQHKDGTSPKFLLRYNTTSGKTVFGSDVSDRFSVSTDAPKYVAYLNIKNVQGKDEADYYCGSWNRDGTAYHCETARWRSETKTSKTSFSCIAEPWVTSSGPMSSQLHKEINPLWEVFKGWRVGGGQEKFSLVTSCGIQQIRTRVP